MGKTALVRVAFAAGIAFAPHVAFAQSVSPSPSPSPSATPLPGSLTWSLDGSQVFIDQQTGGPGTAPPEGDGFSKGNPLSPNTPYDTWSSAPQVPGLAGIVQYTATPRYIGRATFVSLDLGLGFVTGSVTNAAYWGESLLPTYNSHLGSTALPYAIVFPQNTAGDRGDAFRASILGAAYGATNGAWALRAGYFDLAQTNRFIFIAPTLTSVTPSLGFAPAETLGNGPVALSSWPSPPPGLPLLGVDATAKFGTASAEFSDAALPDLPGTQARIVDGSVFVDRGEGTRYGVQFTHVTTGGVPIATTTMYGADAATFPGAQGDLPVSTLGGQRATIVGASASFHAARDLDAVVEVARQWYDADGVFEPGSQKPGGYYHLALVRKVKRSTATLEAFRFEPRYATPILPYGIPENIWSSAWSWPGQWLKSTYQVSDNTAIGVNRDGYRAKYAIDGGPLEIHLQLAGYRQIEEATLSNVHQTGFVDGFFLPQPDGFGTRGTQAQFASWVAWHPKFGTVTLDYVVDELHRPAFRTRPQDLVDYEAPQRALNYSRPLSAATIIDLGYGYYSMTGTWATTPIDYGQATFTAGAELQESAQGGVFVQFRHNSLHGIPSLPGGPSPNFGANQLIVEQRIHF